MALFSDWKSLKPLDLNGSPSTFEAYEIVTPGSVLSYRYAITLGVYFNEEGLVQLGIVLGTLGQGAALAVPVSEFADPKFLQEEWRFQVTRGPDSTIIFDHDVKIEYTVIAIENGGVEGDQLVFFTWFDDDNETAIAITVPTGSSDDPAPTVFAQASGNSIPGGGTDDSTNYALIQLFWESPVWNFPIETGDRLNIVFHNVGLRNSQQQPIDYDVPYVGVQTRNFLESPLPHHVRDARIGTSWMFYTSDAGLRNLRNERRHGQFLSLLDPIIDSGSIRWVHGFRRGPTLQCILEKSHEFFLATSHDEGQTWTEGVSMFQGIECYGVPEVVNEGVVIVLARAIADGTDSYGADFLTNALLRVTLSRGGDNQWSVQSKVMGGTPPPSTGFAGISRSGSTLFAAAKDDTQMRFFVSRDECSTWAEITPPDPPAT